MWCWFYRVTSGKHIGKESCQINIITRNPKDELPIFFANDPGQIKTKKINKFNQDEIDNQIEGSDVVFNLIGILAESKSLHLILYT